MVRNMTKWSAYIVLFGILLVVALSAQGSDKPATATKPQKPSVKVIPVTIHPAVLPTPLMKYHLLPTFLESTPGNAVPCYLKALIIHMQRWRNICNESQGNESDLDQLVQWLDMPLDALPRDRVRKLVGPFSGLVKDQLIMAVRRERCDWDMPLRQGRIYEILLPELQEFRNMARIVALRARLQMAEGKYTEAIHSLQTGYGMARQVAEQPFLVSGAVGTAIANMMSDQLSTLCQQPGAPNLYWSITELPSPLIDRQKSIEAEYDGLYLQYPELQAVRHAQYAPEQWDVVLRKIVSETVRYQNMFQRNKSSGKDQAAEVAKIIAHALEAIPKAKADLAAVGYAQKELDAMPPAQIVVLHVLEMYDRIRDEQFKWCHLPYWQAQKGIESFERDLEAAKKQELVPTASLDLPVWKNSAGERFARTDRQLAALRCIEALRLYTATHEGKLPTTLDEIKEVPIPLNPVTGKAFGYRLDGQTAVLDADGGLAAKQYRVTVAK